MIPIRYIRDWLDRNSQSQNNNWIEIKAIIPDGTNVALGKGVTPSLSGSGNPALVTDGDITCISGITGTQFYISGPVPPQSVTIDLGSVHMDVQNIIVWHWYSDARTYHGTRTEISTDGVNWLPLFDSAVSGEYVETVSGHIIPLSTDLAVAHGGNYFPFGFVAVEGYFLPSTLPERPTSMPVYNQATARSAGGVGFGYSPVRFDRSLNIHWTRLTDFDTIRLTEFFATVKGMAADFTVFDAPGAVGYVAGFATPKLDIVDRVYGLKEVSLFLRGTPNV